MLSFQKAIFTMMATGAIALLAAPTSFASLGEHERTIESDRVAVHGKKAVVDHGSYRVHEIQTDARQTIREYVDSKGNIFAITWRGARQPDIAQLFGSYYKEFRDAESASPAAAPRGPRRIDSDNISVIKSGHMGDVRGKAYIPKFLPDGVSLGDLK